MSQNIPNSELSARVCLKNHATRLPARTLISISIAGVLSTWTAHTHAQESFAPDAVVSAARTTQAVTDALPSTTVITRADIESATVSDVVSLLRQQVGLNVRQSGTRGAESGVAIRGGEPKHTLILVDGVPLMSLSTGKAALEQIPLALIDRIEIVRSNMSALYGSQATGGLVQIFTRHAITGNQADVRIALGDKGQKQASTQLSMGNDTVHLTAGVAHERVKAVSSKNGVLANPDKDGYRNNSGNIAVRVTPSERSEYGLRFYQTNGRKDNDGFYSRNQTREQQVSAYANNQWTDTWSTRIDVSSSMDQSRDFSDFGSELYKTSTQQLSLQNKINLGNGLLIAGLSDVRQKLKSSMTYADNQHLRVTQSVWLGYNLDKNRHHLQINGRYDDINHVGQYTTGALNYGFDVMSDWRVFAGVSNGFTAPSFNDMYFPYYRDDVYKYIYESSPNLKPEKSTYVQMGVQFSKEYYGTRVTYFDTRYRNKITYHAQYDALSGYTYGSMANVDRARIQGLEWHGWLNQSGWNVDLGLTYQEVRNRDTQKILDRQPKWLANLSIGKGWGKWSAQVDWQAQSAITDYDENAYKSVTVSGFGVLNTSVFYQVRKDLKFGLTVGNLLDRQYQSQAGYNMMPRNVLFSVNYKPNW